MALADLLAELRIARGMSQEQLAEAARLSVRAIGDLERGATRRPQRATLRALADGLSLSTEERARFEQAGRAAPPVTRARPPAGARLPLVRSPMVGRGDDLASVCALLSRPATRLVTVTGPPGIGKSRLALEAAWRLTDAFDVVEWLDLAETADDPGSAVAARLVMDAARDTPPPHRAQRLIVLDGFAHGDSCAAALASLLTRHAELRLLVTAHMPLRVRAEHLWPLGPLPVPSTGSEDRTGGAVELLRQRATQVRPGFSEDPGTLAGLARRLGGNPLAIELAALRLQAQNPSDLDAQLRIELAGAAQAETREPGAILRRVIRGGLDRLPRRDAQRLAVLSRLTAGTTPRRLHSALVEVRLPTDLLEATIAGLAAAGFLHVYDHAGQVRLTVPPAVRRLAAGSERGQDGPGDLDEILVPGSRVGVDRYRMRSLADGENDLRQIGH